MDIKDMVKVERLYCFDSADSKLKAFVDLNIMDCFIVKGLRIFDGAEGLFLSMPREKSKDGKWYDIFFPTSKHLRQGVEEVALEAFEKKRLTPQCSAD